MKHVDCRGLACPQPVLLTKKAIEETSEEKILVVVDGEAARANVTRFAQSRGCRVSAEDRGDEFHLTIERGARQGPVANQPIEAFTCTPAKEGRGPGKDVVIVFRSDEMGVGDPALGKILVQALIKTIPECDERPKKMVFYNRGVYLAAEGSEVVPKLKELAAGGVEMLVCGTCLDYYNLKERVAVGAVSNMFAILDAMLRADKVICP